MKILACAICDYERSTEDNGRAFVGCGCGCGRLICTDCAETYPPMTEEARAVYLAAAGGAESNARRRPDVKFAGKSTVDIYPVGLLHDLRRFHGEWLHDPAPGRRRRALRRLWRDFARSWRRRSYWNGFLAEDGGLPRCGHGWTKRRALRDLDRVFWTAHWAQHTCGTVRLRAEGATYCVTCNRKTRTGWTPAESNEGDQT